MELGKRYSVELECQPSPYDLKAHKKNNINKYFFYLNVNKRVTVL